MESVGEIVSVVVRNWPWKALTAKVGAAVNDTDAGTILVASIASVGKTVKETVAKAVS